MGDFNGTEEGIRDQEREAKTHVSLNVLQNLWREKWQILIRDNKVNRRQRTKSSNGQADGKVQKKSN